MLAERGTREFLDRFALIDLNEAIAERGRYGGSINSSYPTRSSGPRLRSGPCYWSRTIRKGFHRTTQMQGCRTGFDIRRVRLGVDLLNRL
jgi:hypothetical protein